MTTAYVQIETLNFTFAPQAVIVYFDATMTSIVAAPYARTMTLTAHKSHNWRGDAQQRFLICKGVKPRSPPSCQPRY